jgi:hypothetical protein
LIAVCDWQYKQFPTQRRKSAKITKEDKKGCWTSIASFAFLRLGAFALEIESMTRSSFVIPAKAGIQCGQPTCAGHLDSRLRGNDGSDGNDGLADAQKVSFQRKGAKAQRCKGREGSPTPFFVFLRDLCAFASLRWKLVCNELCIFCIALLRAVDL